WIKQAVDEGRYGKVLDASFRRVGAMPPGWFSNGEMSGGAILDLHVHDTDFVYHMLGMPKAVYSRGYSRHTGRTDYIVTQYDFGKDGPVVSSEGSWSMQDAFGFSMRCTVNFEKATADFTIDNEQGLIVHEGDKSTPIEMDSDGYHEELRYFVDCVANKRKPEIVTAEDAVQSIKIVEAEARSIETGEVVRL
ncbi:MAG: Gfo/Idh/MocA family oxidoreductase, partial [Phycisphaeraceae bacterium]